jgi:hypothetical protein
VRPRLILLVLAVLAVLAFAACGGDDDGGGGEAVATTAASAPDEGTLAAAASNATEAGSSKVEFTVTTQVPEQEGPVTVSGEGVFDYATRQGTLTYDLSELLDSLGQDASSEPVEMILDGNVFYMRFPLLSSLVPGGKPWIKFDLEALAGQQGIDLSQLQSVNQGDPAQTLDYLRAAGSVEEVGTEDIRGVETTHYQGVIELDKVAELAPAESREQVRRSIDQLKEQAGVSELPVDVWVDSNGLPARIQYSFEGSLAGGTGEDLSSVVTMDLFDYGVDVNVEPPPPDEVTDLAELSAAAGGTGATTG